MKFLIVIFLGTLIVVCANKGQQFRPNAKNSEFPDKCWYEETKQAIAIDEEYSPNDGKTCQKIACQEEFVLRFETCPPTSVVKPICLIPSDYTKQYPDCCPQRKPDCF